MKRIRSRKTCCCMSLQLQKVHIFLRLTLGEAEDTEDDSLEEDGLWHKSTTAKGSYSSHLTFDEAEDTKDDLLEKDGLWLPAADGSHFSRSTFGEAEEDSLEKERIFKLRSCITDLILNIISDDSRLLLNESFFGKLMRSL